MKIFATAIGIIAAAILLSRAFPSPTEVHSDELHDVEVLCLTQAIYFESASEPEKSQRAVAEVVLNRRDSGKFPNFVCDVITDKGQFSWFHGWPMRPGNMNAWWQLYDIAKDEMKKRPVEGDIMGQIIPLEYLFFCSGEQCLRACKGTIIGNQCYYAR